MAGRAARGGLRGSVGTFALAAGASLAGDAVGGGGALGSAVMMLTGGIDAAEGKSYLGDTGMPVGRDAGADAAEAVSNGGCWVCASATGASGFAPRVVHSAA